MSKKILLVISAVALIAALGVGGTLAYITTATEGINVVNVGNVKIRVHHNERSSEEIKLIPNVLVDTDKFTVDNTGDHDAYIRIKLTMANMDFDQFEKNAPKPSVKEENGWKIYNGYAYYKNIVKPKGSVSFVGQIKLPAEVNVVTATDKQGRTTYLENDFPDKDLQINVYAEAIQADHLETMSSGDLSGYPLWPDVDIKSNTTQGTGGQGSGTLTTQ